MKQKKCKKLFNYYNYINLWLHLLFFLKDLILFMKYFNTFPCAILYFSLIDLFALWKSVKIWFDSNNHQTSIFNFFIVTLFFNLSSRINLHILLLRLYSRSTFVHYRKISLLLISNTMTLEIVACSNHI